MKLIVKPGGRIVTIYTDEVDYNKFGKPTVRRASHVEPDANGQWYADMSPVNGPQLGPFPKRSDALDAEMAWLNLMLNEVEPLPESQ
jgi:hypothetical protein